MTASAGPQASLRSAAPADGDTVDFQAAARSVRELLVALGEDPAADHLQDTPRRVAAAYAELLSPVAFEMTTFANEEGYDELVLARDIPFTSLCEHHLLPFTGRAHVGYLPGSGSWGCRSSPAWWRRTPAPCRCRSA